MSLCPISDSKSVNKGVLYIKGDCLCVLLINLVQIRHKCDAFPWRLVILKSGNKRVVLDYLFTMMSSY